MGHFRGTDVGEIHGLGCEHSVPRVRIQGDVPRHNVLESTQSDATHAVLSRFRVFTLCWRRTTSVVALQAESDVGGSELHIRSPSTHWEAIPQQCLQLDVAPVAAATRSG